MLATLATNFLWGCSAICCLKLNELWAYFAVSKTLPSYLSLCIRSTTLAAFYAVQRKLIIITNLGSNCAQNCRCLCLVTYRSWRIYYDFVYRDALELPITQRAGGGGVGNPL